jgi:hypothetical protein
VALNVLRGVLCCNPYLPQGSRPLRRPWQHQPWQEASDVSTLASQHQAVSNWHAIRGLMCMQRYGIAFTSIPAMLNRLTI